MIIRCLTLVSFLCFPLHNAQHLLPVEYPHIMYGKLMNWEKSFLPMDGIGFENGVPPKLKTNMSLAEALSDSYFLEDFDTIFAGFNSSKYSGQDGDQFHKLNLQILNVTQESRKRFWVGRVWWIGFYHLNWWWRDISDTSSTWGDDKEPSKRMRLLNIVMTYLVHSRSLVHTAMIQRNHIRNDKRYKIGYLFNRLRRYKTEMLKMVKMMQEQMSIWWNKRDQVTIRLYEELIRMDVDVRDTVWMIRDLYEKREPYDYVDNF